MAEIISCDICERRIPRHMHYVVRMDVFADPEMPEVSREEMEGMDFDRELEKLLEEMKGMSGEELQDQVHRRFEYRICLACQRKVLADPLGRKDTGKMPVPQKEDTGEAPVPRYGDMGGPPMSRGGA